MHHTVAQLRAMMPQADYLHHLGLIMTDMEAAAKAGKSHLYIEDGTHGVDDMAAWRDDNTTCRAARIAHELTRLGYDVRYKLIQPRTTPVVVMMVEW